jgi:hydroxymethylbilane synthase
MFLALPVGIVKRRSGKSDHLRYFSSQSNLDFLNESGTIASGSLRRQAQWLNKYPTHKVVGLRGNVNSRMKNLMKATGTGCFCDCSLERINLKPDDFIDLDWMIPAPLKAMVVVAMQNDAFTLNALSQLNDIETEIVTYIERQFLKTLEGGCTAPIGTLAIYDDEEDTIHFQGVLFSLDGKEKMQIDKTVPIEEWKKLGFLFCSNPE